MYSVVYLMSTFLAQYTNQCYLTLLHLQFVHFCSMQNIVNISLNTTELAIGWTKLKKYSVTDILDVFVYLVTQNTVKLEISFHQIFGLIVNTI